MIPLIVFKPSSPLPASADAAVAVEGADLAMELADFQGQGDVVGQGDDRDEDSGLKGVLEHGVSVDITGISRYRRDMAALPRIIFSLKPEDIAKLDALVERHEAESRSQVLRKLIRDAAKEKLK